MQDGIPPQAKEIVGHINFVGLGSPILCERGAHNWDVLRFHSEILYFVFPPMSAEGVGHTKYPRPNLHRFPPLSKVAPEFLNVDANKLLPALDAENPKRLLPLGSNSTDDEALIFPCDTVVLRVIHHNFLTEDMIANAILRIRRMTGQFWISQPTTYLDGPKSLRISLFRSGGMDRSPVMSYSNISNEIPRVIRCTEDIWNQAWRDALTKPEIDTIDFVHDAHHRKFQEPFERYLLEAGLAVEKFKYWLWDRLYDQKRCEKSHQRAASGDTKKVDRYFGSILYDVTGRSLDLEIESSHSSISRVWRGRGLAAHSKQDQIKKEFPLAQRDEFGRQSIEALYKLQEGGVSKACWFVLCSGASVSYAEPSKAQGD